MKFSYETTLIIKPDLSNDQAKSLYSTIDEFFSQNNTSLNYQEDWGIRNLKTNISKYSKGLYKFYRYEAQNDFPFKLEKFLKFNTETLRSLTVKTTEPIEQKTSMISDGVE